MTTWTAIWTCAVMATVVCVVATESNAAPRSQFDPKGADKDPFLVMVPNAFSQLLLLWLFAPR